MVNRSQRLIAKRRSGHVWGMYQRTARDNSGIERTVVIWLRPARTLRSSSVREGMPCMACKRSDVSLAGAAVHFALHGVSTGARID
jgi:hypothetical protein